MDKKLLLTLFTFLLLPQLAIADMIIPLSFYTIPWIPVIIFIEAFLFWLLASKAIKVPIGFWKLVWVTLVANIVTSILGTLVPLYKSAEENVMFIGVAFLFSVFIEWGIYIPFLKKVPINKLFLLYISFIVNLVTYTGLALLIYFQLI